MKLITNWRRCWRLRSVQAAALLSLFSVLQAEVLPLIEFAVPARYWPWVSAVVGVAIVVLRIIQQPGALVPSDTERASPPAPGDKA